jgi:uncharacterized membrane protein
MPDPGQFHMATVHLYRGEMQRMVVWRSRLDQTTHWALLLTAGITTFALGAVLVPHFIMLLGLAINTLCMIIEGRRYQHLHHSKWRINLLEHNFFASCLCPLDPLLEPTWRQQLSSDLGRPHFTIGHVMAIRLRLRRNYLMLFYFITAVWLTKLFIHPTSVSSVAELYQRLAVGTLLPSWFVAASAALFIGAVTVMAVLTPSEERLERWTKEERTRLVSASDVQVWETRKQGPHQ